jgi:hypothetical protein
MALIDSSAHHNDQLGEGGSGRKPIPGVTLE